MNSLPVRLSPWMSTRRLEEQAPLAWLHTATIASERPTIMCYRRQLLAGWYRDEKRHIVSSLVAPNLPNPPVIIRAAWLLFASGVAVFSSISAKDRYCYCR
jgi:hypothetical protein